MKEDIAKTSDFQDGGHSPNTISWDVWVNRDIVLNVSINFQSVINFVLANFCLTALDYSNKNKKFV